MECLFCKTPTQTTKYCSKSCKGKHWYKLNSEHNKALSKAWRDSHKAERKAMIDAYRSTEAYREHANERQKAKRLEDLNYRLACNLRSRLSKAVRRGRKVGSAITELGCTIEQLKLHLESQFEPDMSWDNYGQWEVDHKEPLSKVDLSNEVELKRVCHYSNLKPLWSKDNKVKSNKTED